MNKKLKNFLEGIEIEDICFNFLKEELEQGYSEEHIRNMLALPCIEHKPEIKLSLVFAVLEDEHFNDFFLQQLCMLLKNLPIAIWENVQSRLIDLVEIKYYLFSRAQMLSLAYTIELMNAKNYKGAYKIANLIYERIPIENDFIEFSEEDIRIRLAKLAYSTGRHNINEKINSIMTIKLTLKKAQCQFLLGIVHYYTALCLAISGCCYNENTEKDYFEKSYNKGFPLSETYLQYHNL